MTSNKAPEQKNDTNEGAFTFVCRAIQPDESYALLTLNLVWAVKTPMKTILQMMYESRKMKS